MEFQESTTLQLLKNTYVVVDDFGISDGVNKAILNLVHLNMCHGVSVLINTTNSVDDYKKLLLLRDRCDIGLHLNFSIDTGVDYIVTPLNSLRLLLFKKDRLLLKSSIDLQISNFFSVFGMLPDYIDSHHHIHQLPVISSILNRSYSKSFNISSCWIRNSYISPFYIFKNSLRFSTYEIFKNLSFGFLGFFYKFKLNKNNIPTNGSLLGTYNNFNPERFATISKLFTNYPQNNNVFYFHPGFTDISICKFDSLNEEREIEYNVWTNVSDP